MMQEMRVAQDSIRNGILESNGANGKQRDYRMPIYSKVSKIFRTLKPGASQPFL